MGYGAYWLMNNLPGLLNNQNEVTKEIGKGFNNFGRMISKGLPGLGGSGPAGMTDKEWEAMQDFDDEVRDEFKAADDEILDQMWAGDHAIMNHIDGVDKNLNGRIDTVQAGVDDVATAVADVREVTDANTAAIALNEDNIASQADLIAANTSVIAAVSGKVDEELTLMQIQNAALEAAIGERNEEVDEHMKDLDYSVRGLQKRPLDRRLYFNDEKFRKVVEEHPEVLAETNLTYQSCMTGFRQVNSALQEGLEFTLGTGQDKPGQMAYRKKVRTDPSVAFAPLTTEQRLFNCKALQLYSKNAQNDMFGWNKLELGQLAQMEDESKMLANKGEFVATDVAEYDEDLVQVYQSEFNNTRQALLDVHLNPRLAKSLQDSIANPYIYADAAQMVHKGSGVWIERYG